MNLLLFVFFGLALALLARTIQPHEEPSGWAFTGALGVGGALVGGTLASLIAGLRVVDLHTPGLLGSIVGACLVLLLDAPLARRRHVA